MAKKELSPYMKVLKKIDQFGVLVKELPVELITDREIGVIHHKMIEWDKKSEELLENEDKYLATVFEQKVNMAHQLLNHAQRRKNLSNSTFSVINGFEKSKQKTISQAKLILINGKDTVTINE